MKINGKDSYLALLKGEKGDKGQDGAGCYVNGVATEINFTSDPQEQIDAKANQSSLDTTNSNVTANTNSINSLKTSLSNVKSQVLLWSNPNPTSEFAAQTISVNFTGYQFYVVVCGEVNESGTRIITSGEIPVGRRARLSWSSGDSPYNNAVSRTIDTATTTSLTFTNGSAFSHTGGSVTANGRAIPLYIYGIKTGV